MSTEADDSCLDAQLQRLAGSAALGQVTDEPSHSRSQISPITGTVVLEINLGLHTTL